MYTTSYILLPLYASTVLTNYVQKKSVELINNCSQINPDANPYSIWILTHRILPFFNSVGIQFFPDAVV